jgi:hypothetical protein
MRVPAVASAERMPRRSRYLIPMDFPYRGEVIAAITLVGLFAHLLLAQLALLLTVAFHAISRVSRWRPAWLAAPAAAGLLWALAIGPARALAGFAAGPRQVLGYIGGVGSHPGRLLHPFGAFAGITHWLPRQLPLALVLAAAEAAVAWWLYRLHSGEDLPPVRPGLVVAARRRWVSADIRSGGVVTRDGGCLGLDPATGRRAGISWREAEGGVLCTGRSAAALTDTGFLLAQAAIRRRKPVIVIDLTGSASLADALAAVSAGARAPLWRFGDPGRGYYEPLRGGDPARAAALVTGMIDWTGVSDQHRQACAAYLADAMTVLAAAPGDPRVAVLDDLTGILSPNALTDRLRQVPGYHPDRAAIAERVGVSADLLRADPAAVFAAAEQLPRLRGSSLGRWLCPAPLPPPPPPPPSSSSPPPPPPPPPAPPPPAHRPDVNGQTGALASVRISLGRTVRDRGVTLFSLDRDVHGQSASMIASLAALDLMTVCAELRGMSVPGDTLAWINGCESLEGRVLAEMIACGPGSGTAVLLTTSSAVAAERLAAEANVVLVRGPADEVVASRVAALTGAGSAPHTTTASAAASTATAAPVIPATAAPAAVFTTAAAPAAPATAAVPSTPITAASPALPATAAAHATPATVGAGPSAEALRALTADAFALLVRSPRWRALPKCLHVPAGRPRHPGARA